MVLMASDNLRSGFQRGAMAMIILSLLKYRDMYGYQLVQEIEKQSGDRLPTVYGDITDQWGDFAAIAPLWMSMKRRAMRQMISAETMSSLSDASV